MIRQRSPLVFLTCGPGFEPIDEVRRITNHSTGRLGVVLAECFVANGFEVHCFCGELAQFIPRKGAKCRVERFSTGEDLFRLLRERADQMPERLLHAAALSDFCVKEMRAGDGKPLSGAKIPSQIDHLTLDLVPARKLLPHLRELYPQAWIAGWKYEVEGSREQALARGAEQIVHAVTDACVVNGRAYGSGFGVLLPGGQQYACADAEDLGVKLLQLWASKSVAG